jgi:hypothetical protein
MVPQQRQFVSDPIFAEHNHAALRQQLFDVAETRSEAEVETDGVADHIEWIAVTLEGKSRHRGLL